ncbi:MAG: type IV secretion system DNA-binding domain-containing protein [Candidatus Moranbacteria bacterium]|nr:type IV secretion system DNA-binding domain-containing protein [Candidatus Moranbacteria bacterium]
MPEINFFAKTNFRNQEVSFGIKRDDRRRHMYVIGKTGMGKSNLLENMAIQDIRNGEGVCVVDPHGEFAEKMLQAVPAERINDVVYFNPSDAEFPIAFNILESVADDKKNLVASGMMGVFKKIWPDVWSARMEYILSNTILALLDFPGSTMLGVNRMMSDKDFRKRVYPKIKDPVVKSFWLNEFDKWEDKFRKEAVAAIQNKVGQFLSSSVIRHIVGQPKSTIDMRDIMDNQKILIVNLSKGRIGEDSMRLLGGMLITKIQLAAMSRVDMPEEDRVDFYLYVDEFQNFATESFANILSEARKYKLNLILAHQYINQLIFDGNATVRDAVFGNVGTIVSFRVGAEDAEALEKEFEPVFMMNDIVNLSKYHIYLKLMIDGVAGDAFSATTLPPLDLTGTSGNEEKIIRVTREKCGRPKSEVEDRIARWSGMEVFKEAPAGGQEEADDMDSELYEGPSVTIEPPPASTPTLIFRPTNPPVESPVIRPVVTPVARPIAVPVAQKSVAPVAKTVVQTAVSATMQKIESALSQPSAPAEVAVEKPKEMYSTICATCEEIITVPFKPDPARPAFCRECLKEHQRMMARKKNELAEQQAPAVRVNPIVAKIEPEKNIAPESQRVVHAPQDKPMSLSQMSHIAPKAFRSQKQKPDLGAIRSIIQEARTEK